MSEQDVFEKIKSDVEDEVNKDAIDKAKRRYKDKVLELKRARMVVANVDRELQDLELEIRGELGL